MALKLELLNYDYQPVIENKNQSSVESLALQWAKKYLQNLYVKSSNQESSNFSRLSEIISPTGREKTAKKIIGSLRTISAQAWNKTEELLAEEIIRHGIDTNLINPWEVAGDSFKIYQKTLNVYTQQSTSKPFSQVMKLVAEDG